MLGEQHVRFPQPGRPGAGNTGPPFVSLGSGAAEGFAEDVDFVHGGGVLLLPLLPGLPQALVVVADHLQAAAAAAEVADKLVGGHYFHHASTGMGSRTATLQEGQRMYASV